jgi:hypothetical protein
MKKIALSLILLSSSLSCAQEGLLIHFMQDANDMLPIPSAESIAATATLIGGATLGGITAFQKSAEVASTRELQTRSVSFSLASALFSSPVLWTALGGCIAAFGINYFIGYEMGIIIETKGTLKALEKQIQLWQIELPHLKETQENIELKVKNALTVLDTITPLVIKLAKNSETVGAAQQVAAIQKELAALKTTVASLTATSTEEVVKTVEKKSHSLFGLGKKKPTSKPSKKKTLSVRQRLAAYGRMHRRFL